MYGARNSQMLSVQKPLFEPADPKSSTEEQAIKMDSGKAMHTNSESKKEKNYFNVPN